MIESLNWFEYLEQLDKNVKSQEQNYQGLKSYISMKARKNNIPVSGKFELTPLCNFSCKMCYVHLETNQLKDQAILTVDTWKSLIQQAWKAGMLSAILTGGECLAYPGFNELFLYLHGLGCEVSVLTNGFLMDKEQIKFFKNHMPSTIQITLYGWNDDVYERVTGRRAFSTVAENIKLATESGLPIAISITPNKYLGEDLIETVRVAKELCNVVNINSCLDMPREETGRSEQRDDSETDLYIRAYKFLDKLEDRLPTEICKEKLPPCGGPSHETSKCGLTCGGGRSSFAIDWKGTMMPCIDFTMIRAYPITEGFDKAWAKVNQEANHWPRVPECEGCAYETVCSSCAVHMLPYAEPGKIPTVLCERTREFVRNGIVQLPDCD